ncbi:MAG TPA: efflux RND transporter periplasmic adaptor subunit [Polyangiaceae bacterium]|nr:efflux RND transporter periplasmic adaptor subunit [Polyangiaceae bacterium]
MPEAKPKRSPRGLLVVAALVTGGVFAYRAYTAPPKTLTLTGLVTTDDVIVSPLVTARVEKLLVKEGDSVKSGDLLAVLSPAELAADSDFFKHSAEGFSGQIAQTQASLRYEELQTGQQIRQAQATLAAVEAQRAEAEATVKNARSNLARTRALLASGALTQRELEQAETESAVAEARLAAVNKQIDAQRAAVGLARANAEQVTARRSALSSIKQQEAAAEAQAEKANVRLGYAEIHAPIDGIVDVRAARAGEVVSAAQPLVTLVNPDDLWVRVDVEETYASRLRIGEELDVRFPSGETRRGKVFLRRVDAGFATQRDVSRTKRDIKTFEIRLRVDNHDRRLAVGMTAYVTLATGA